MKALLVNHSAIMRVHMHQQLRQLGIEEIHEAHNSNGALACLETDVIDLVLADWDLPGGDGLTFLQRLRESHADCVVIMITAEAERDRIVQAIQAGVNDYLVKPFTADRLREKLEKWTQEIARNGIFACEAGR